MGKSWLLALSSYRGLSCALAVVFLVAAVLKGYESLARFAVSGSTWKDSLPGLTGAGIEALFAGWLLMGFLPRLTRCALIGVLLAFANVHVAGMAVGSPSCGCLGRISLAPIYPLTMNLLAAGLLLFGSVPEPPQAGFRWRVGLAGLCLLLATGGLGAAWWLTPRPHDEPAFASLSGDERQLLERVRAGIEQNTASYPQTLSFEMERVFFNRGVTAEKTVTRREADGSILTSTIAPEFRYQFRCTICGESVRREIIRGGSNGRIQIIHQGKYLDINPENKHVAYLPMSAFTGSTDSVDPRTVGFPMPLLRLVDWLRQSDITGVHQRGQGEAETVLVDARLKDGSTRRVQFNASRGWLPTSLHERCPDGSLLLHTSWVYERLPNGGSWFPRSIRDHYWDVGVTRDIEFSKAVRTDGSRQYTVFDPVRQDVEAPEELFDPPIPAGYVVANQAGNGGVIRLTEPVTSPSKLPVYGRPTLSVGKAWPYFLTLNGLVVVLCVVFRRQINL